MARGATATDERKLKDCIGEQVRLQRRITMEDAITVGKLLLSGLPHVSLATKTVLLDFIDSRAHHVADPANTATITATTTATTDGAKLNVQTLSISNR